MLIPPETGLLSLSQYHKRHTRTRENDFFINAQKSVKKLKTDLTNCQNCGILSLPNKQNRGTTGVLCLPGTAFLLCKILLLQTHTNGIDKSTDSNTGCEESENRSISHPVFCLFGDNPKLVFSCAGSVLRTFSFGEDLGALPQGLPPLTPHPAALGGRGKA